MNSYITKLSGLVSKFIQMLHKIEHKKMSKERVLTKDEEQQYNTLLKGLVDIAEACKDAPSGNDERYRFAQGLVAKLFFHCASAFYLSGATEISRVGLSVPKPHVFLDFPSILVLERSAYEALLVFHSVFIVPVDKDEEDFKFYIWRLLEPLHLQRIEFKNPEYKKKQDGLTPIIDYLKNKLKSNRVFLSLSEDLKEKLSDGYLGSKFVRTKNNDIARAQWSNLAEEIGLSRKCGKDRYSFLCDYAHSGSWVISQIIAAASEEEKRNSISVSLRQMMIIMSFMIKKYIIKFPCGQSILEKNDDLRNVVEIWHYAGSHDPDASNEGNIELEKNPN
jgi:hypothetical protein